MNEHQDILFRPNSSWSAPSDFPRLDDVKELGFDTETRDPSLISKGPGFIRRDASVVGFSLATADQSWYFPIAHALGKNLNYNVCVRFLSDLLQDNTRTIIGANLSYDVEAAWSLGIDVKAKLVDIQIAEPLIDEESEAGYSLNALCKKYLGTIKNEDGLREAAQAFGVDPKSGLWNLPPEYVGPYAEYDALAPFKIWELQKKELSKQDLWQVFELEQGVQPILWEMRKKGIPVDLDKTKELAAKLILEENYIFNKLKNTFELNSLPRLDAWSGPVIEQYCNHYEIPFNRTEKGNPSFTKEFLSHHDHPLLRGISEFRELNRLRSTFTESWIFDNEIDGWIHPQWRQLASDDGGTRTGRMAASNPNPQQIPSRAEVAKHIRGLFVAESGKLWGKLDYSQQEPRILTHFAYLCGFTGATEARQAYCNDPDMDFYQFMMDVASVDRRTAKDLYLGRCYGMGPFKLGHKLGCSTDEAKEILGKFDKKVPFVKAISDRCDMSAKDKGFIRTLLGRRRHFDFWSPPPVWKDNKKVISKAIKGRKEALEYYPNKPLSRDFTYKALNALIQGSAADMTKAALIAVHKKFGLIPYMQVHDELDYPLEDMEQAMLVKKEMETCVEMTVPIKCDLDLGGHWK